MMNTLNRLNMKRHDNWMLLRNTKLCIRDNGSLQNNDFNIAFGTYLSSSVSLIILESLCIYKVFIHSITLLKNKDGKQFGHSVGVNFTVVVLG